MIYQYKIFGERHTATNAINALIKSNFELIPTGYDFLGWKHRRAPAESEWKKIDYEKTFFIFMVRNPYDWIVSMHRDAYCCSDPGIINRPLTEFVRYPIEDYENSIKMWNEKNSEFIRMCFQLPNSLIIRHEDLVNNQYNIYKKLKGILPAKEAFTPVVNYINGRGVKNIPLTSIDSDGQGLKQEVIDLINDEIDKEIMTFFEYCLR